ncbi:MAG TPA: EAL domain-containing protein [Jatrophihabitans sp.]|uniref:putative bifunctional diguanylate cyclase/phosphodiesterase n=1 Tax=Jatrophihabitans sp. TaxID=1932789 RepID=UPI002E09CDBD|nr:EAL domain-containing protein [Jatrophihabitans sp.]
MTETGGRRPLPTPAARPHPTQRLIRHNDILDLVVQNASLSNILQVVTGMVEREIRGCRASVLLLDEPGLHLRAAAAPSLPAEYTAAIDGVEIGPQVGTCGTAAYEKRVVITTDIATDPAWVPWLGAAAEAGLAACWSTPFLGLHGRVLGTLAVYFDHPCAPAAGELELLHDAGHLAAVAVQHDAVRRLLHDTHRTHPLTGLPNRVALTERLRAVEADAVETGDRFAVVQVAIEGMSHINEGLGPTVGDSVLRTVAGRLGRLIEGRGVAAHLWGCDFVVLVVGLLDDDDARTMAEQIRSALTEPFDVEGMTLVVDVSIGLSTYGSDVLDAGDPADEPLRTANVALERAKLAGNQVIGVYDPHSDPGAAVRLLAPELRRGMDDEELTLAYQPVVTLGDEKLDHYEALLRWASPHGTVSPEEFVPVAEQTGLVADLGRYAFSRALAETARVRAAGRDVGVSVNLSVLQLSDEGLPGRIADLLGEYDVPAHRVTLEVTEGVLLNSAKGWGTLARIRDVGVRVSLDDFGTGFSQIGYLRRFRFDEIKIDRTFVRDMESDVMARAIVVGTIGLARAADMDVVAEGIENRTQADLLRELGCTHGQGYLFGRPASTPSAT